MLTWPLGSGQGPQALEVHLRQAKRRFQHESKAILELFQTQIPSKTSSVNRFGGFSKPPRGAWEVFPFRKELRSSRRPRTVRGESRREIAKGSEVW